MQMGAGIASTGQGAPLRHAPSCCLKEHQEIHGDRSQYILPRRAISSARTIQQSIKTLASLCRQRRLKMPPRTFLIHFSYFNAKLCLDFRRCCECFSA